MSSFPDFCAFLTNGEHLLEQWCKNNGFGGGRFAEFCDTRQKELETRGENASAPYTSPKFEIKGLEIRALPLSAVWRLAALRGRSSAYYLREYQLLVE